MPHILAPTEYVGQHHGAVPGAAGRVQRHEIPGPRPGWISITSCLLNEIVYDFFDALKSRTKGYASLRLRVQGLPARPSWSSWISCSTAMMVDALSFIVHADKAYARGRRNLAEKLKENIPRQLFEVPIQAAIGGKIIARETVKAMRKDVLAKCYGGDITRKKKLLEKQKEGKKRMRQSGQRSRCRRKRLCRYLNWISFFDHPGRGIFPRPFVSPGFPVGRPCKGGFL